MSVNMDVDPAPSNQSLATNFKDQGNAYYKQGLYQKSIEWYTKAIEADPSNPSLYNNRSAAYLMLNNYLEAHKDANRSVSLDATNVKSLLRLAKCCLCLGDLDEAKRLSSVVRESEPSSLDLASLNEKLELLSQTYILYEKQLSASDLSHALHLITKCINFAPGSLDYNLKRLHLLIQLKRFTEAKHYVETLLKSNNSCVDLLFYRGLCLYYLDHLDKAITHFQHVLRLHPDHTETQKAFKRARNLARLKDQGNEFIHARQFANAYDAYTEALQLDPLHDAINAKLYCNRACAAFNLNRFNESLKDCDAALKLDPTYLKALTRRAKCYSALEEYEKAVNEWRSIVQIDPSSEHKRNLRAAETALNRSKHLDYYKVLGLKKNASFDEIKQAYKKNALRYHPDRHTDADEATKQEQERKFKEVGEAYSVLSDPQKRRQYDNGELGTYSLGSNGPSAENIFTEVFQGFGTSTVHFCFG